MANICFLREVLRFFSASCSTTLAMDSAIALMKAEIADEHIVVMLNDIRDLNNIASTGFQFTTIGVHNQHEEVRSFLLNHPSTMAADIDTIIIKLRTWKIFLRKTKTTTRKKTCAGPA